MCQIQIAKTITIVYSIFNSVGDNLDIWCGVHLIQELFSMDANLSSNSFFQQNDEMCSQMEYVSNSILFLAAHWSVFGSAYKLYLHSISEFSWSSLLGLHRDLNPVRLFKILDRRTWWNKYWTDLIIRVCKTA